jgi:signal transduction histidine kinase
VQIAAQATDNSGVASAPHVIFDMQMDAQSESLMLHTNLASATRALTLLLDNARKFTRPAEARGPVAVVKQEHVTLRLEAQATQLLFIVEDTGIGVPPEEAEHIFDEFVQLDEYYDGTGNGLAVARSLARRLGGDVVLDTSYSGGARFVLTLPIAP